MKNKIHNYDFLIVGAGLIGSIAAYSLHKNKFKVLIIDKKKTIIANATKEIEIIIRKLIFIFLKKFLINLH